MPRSATPFPRAIATFNGQPVRWTDLLQVTWEPNVAYAADGLTLLLRNLTSEGLLLSDAIRKKQLIDLYLGYVQDPDVWSQSELGHVFHGKVDGVLPHFGEGLTLEVRARDLSSSLLDQQVGAELNAQSFDNMTASDFAAFFAKKYGLGTQITATTVTADRQNFENQSEWALLVTLAMREGFICSVDKDGVLYFGPRRTNQPILSTWSYYTAPADLLSFDPDDSALAINRVTVLRYAGPTQDFSGSWPTEDDLQTDPAILAAGGQVIDYTTYSVTAQSSADCQDQAQKLYTTMNRRRISATARMEGDPSLVGDVLIHVGGLVGRMENDYYVERAVHTLDVNTGYVTQVDLTNIQPTASEVYRDPLYQPVTQQEQQNAAAAIQGAPPSGQPVTLCGDLRGKLPTIGAYPKRPTSGIVGVTFHYTAGPPSQTPLDIARYQISPAAAPQTGTGQPFPGIAYSFVVDQNGCLSQCWDLDVACWHSGAIINGVSRNTDHIGIVYTGNVEPNDKQIQGLADGILFCQQQLGKTLTFEGHRDAPYPTECPGPKWPGWRSKVQALLGSGQAAPTTGAGLTWPLNHSEIPGVFNKAPSYVQTAIRQSGWPTSEYDNAAAISYNETGGTWNKRAGPSATNDWGLWQINRGFWGTSPSGHVYTTEELYDPNTNAKIAYYVWTKQGWCGWATAPGLGLCSR